MNLSKPARGSSRWSRVGPLSQTYAAAEKPDVASPSPTGLCRALPRKRGALVAAGRPDGKAGSAGVVEDFDADGVPVVG
jgi:hypothetical protein